MKLSFVVQCREDGTLDLPEDIICPQTKGVYGIIKHYNRIAPQRPSGLTLTTVPHGAWHTAKFENGKGLWRN